MNNWNEDINFKSYSECDLTSYTSFPSCFFGTDPVTKRLATSNTRAKFPWPGLCAQARAVSLARADWASGERELLNAASTVAGLASFEVDAASLTGPLARTEREVVLDAAPRCGGVSRRCALSELERLGYSPI